MSQRFIAIIDADLNLAGHLQAELSRYGLGVEAAPDSNELMVRKDSLPDLIVLCIDPKRTGWAVCNRLRKSPVLKSIPLIITSAEATEKDFDDHKKLKTRAEEYLHKPFGVEALLDKIATLIGLPEGEAEPLTAEGEIEVESEELSAVEVEPDDLGVELADDLASEDELTVDGTSVATNLPGFANGREEEHTRIGNEIDGEVDLETNAAFANIGLDEPGEAPRGEPESPFDDESFDLPDHVSGDVFDPAPAALAPETPLARSDADDSAPINKLTAEELGLGLEEVARDAAALVAATPTPTARPLAPAPSEPRDAAGAEAQRENERLRRENEELRARPKAEAASSSFSREREFLNLRETINKKEKEVLDLKDALDSKERQALDGKDRLRDAERKLREAEEHSLATERELVSAREKVEALSSDKERGGEREKQLKGRLEDAQKAALRVEAELEATRQKAAADLASFEERQNQASAKQRDEVAQLREARAEALAELKTEHDRVLAAERQAREAEKQQLLQDHAEVQQGMRNEYARVNDEREAKHKVTLETELRNAERHHAEVLVDLEGKHEAAVRDANARNKEELRVQSEEARRALEQAANEHGAEINRQQADHDRAIEQLDEAKQQALAQASAIAAEQQAAALAEQHGVHEGELKALRETHSRKLQALEESHEDLKAGMQARHAAAADDLRNKHAATVGEFEAAIAERDQIITQQRDHNVELDAVVAAAGEQTRAQASRIAELDVALEGLRAELAERDGTIQQRNQRIGELEQESTRYQDQILRAYQRIKSDESIVARAKKALAIALTLLEESAPDGSEEASS
jgi:DNA-binding response OmpR family regulator